MSFFGETFRAASDLCQRVVGTLPPPSRTAVIATSAALVGTGLVLSPSSASAGVYAAVGKQTDLGAGAQCAPLGVRVTNVDGVPGGIALDVEKCQLRYSELAGHNYRYFAVHLPKMVNQDGTPVIVNDRNITWVHEEQVAKVVSCPEGIKPGHHTFVRLSDKLTQDYDVNFCGAMYRKDGGEEIVPYTAQGTAIRPLGIEFSELETKIPATVLTSRIPGLPFGSPVDILAQDVNGTSVKLEGGQPVELFPYGVTDPSQLGLRVDCSVQAVVKNPASGVTVWAYDRLGDPGAQYERLQDGQKVDIKACFALAGTYYRGRPLQRGGVAQLGDGYWIKTELLQGTDGKPFIVAQPERDIKNRMVSLPSARAGGPTGVGN